MRNPEISFPDHVTTVAGTRVHYIEAGQGDTLILIHGSLCDYRYWRWQINDLSRNFHVVALSLPGCWPDALGRGSDASTYSISKHVEAVAGLCSKWAPSGPVHLLGHSRGAQVALEVALAQPEQVGKLILADPGFPFLDEPSNVPIHLQIAERLGSAALDDVLEEFVDTVNGAGSWRRTVRWFKEMVRDNAWTLVPQVGDIHRAVDPQELRSSLSCHVLLVGGELSPPRYTDRLNRLQALLPQAQRVTVPKAAHGMNLANAPYFNEMLRQFLTPYLVGSLPATPST